MYFQLSYLDIPLDFTTLQTMNKCGIFYDNTAKQNLW